MRSPNPHEPIYVGSPMLRLLVALAIFAAVVFGGAWLAMSWPLSLPWTAGPTEDEVAGDAPVKKPAPSSDAAGDATFFYGAIGAAPDSEDADEDKDGDGVNDESASTASYTLELKMTQDRAEAEGLIATLAAKGVEAYYTPVMRGGHVYYRVRRGIFTSAKAADHAAVALKKDYGVKPQVVRLQ
jgi:septal ring-binding cell division protein DamX